MEGVDVFLLILRAARASCCDQNPVVPLPGESKPISDFVPGDDIFMRYRSWVNLATVVAPHPSLLSLMRQQTGLAG